MTKQAHRKKSNDPTKGIYLRGNVYWLKLIHGGREKCISLECSDYAKAVTRTFEIRSSPERYFSERNPWEDDLNRFLAEKEEGKVKGVRRHKGASGVNSRAAISAFFLDKEIDSIKSVQSSQIENWLDAFKNPNTRKTYHSLLNTFFQWASARHLLVKNPMENLAAPTVHPNQISKKDVIQLPAVTQMIKTTERDDMKFVVLAGCEAGFRKGEIVMCKPEWFNTKADSIYVPCPDKIDGWEPKNRKQRSLPMSARLKAFLIESGWLKDGRKYLLRTDARKESWIYNPKSKIFRWDPKRPLQSLFKRCKVKGSAHTMRHTFASHALMAGVSVWKVAEWMGDHPNTVIRTYGHFIPREGELKGIFPED